MTPLSLLLRAWRTLDRLTQGPSRRGAPRKCSLFGCGVMLNPGDGVVDGRRRFCTEEHRLIDVDERES